MVESSFKYRRTHKERADEQLSWDRPDKAFFASGACHILAYAYIRQHPDEDLEIIFIKPDKKFGSVGTHIFIRKGDHTFDFNGWSMEKDLLDVNEIAYSNDSTGWEYKLETITQMSIEEFCEQNNHRLPKDFAHDVWKRAEDFINMI